MITKEVRKVNNNSNNNSNNASNVSNNNTKPKTREYRCSKACKAQKRKIAKTKGYPFNVWRQTEKKMKKPWNLKRALKAFDNAYNRKTLLKANWRINPMPAEKRAKRKTVKRKTKPKA